MSDPRLYGTIWRWHFYAGLFVLPFILILSITGSIYLFKPQIDRWEESAFSNRGTAGAVSADRQLAVAQAANPGARFDKYRLPRRPGDAAMILLGRPNGTQREVYVSSQGRLLGQLDPEARISATVSRIHGTLLLGRWGDWLVELAASWTIVMIVTGLYLWWPRPFKPAGTIWPRLSLKGRPLYKDFHRVTGFWIAGLVLVMLVSGLPWAGVWGGTFSRVRSELGLVKGPQDWKIGAGSGATHHQAMPGMIMPQPELRIGLPLSTFVAKAQAEAMAFPVVVLPPRARQRFGPPTGEVWTVKSEAQNRRLNRNVTYDPITGTESSRSGFADQHAIDRVINTGVAWHEGQLFGLANQLIGVLTAVALVSISILGAAMWLKRRPRGGFGAPVRTAETSARGLIAVFIVLGVLLPLFGASLLAITAIDLVVRGVQRARFRRSALGPHRATPG